MKSNRLIMMAALFLMTMQSFAQSPVDGLRQMFATGAVSVGVKYEMIVQDTPVSGTSSLLVQGGMYHVHGNGLDVYNNGKAVWTIDESIREVVIEPSSEVEEDYLSNPVLLLVRMDDFFKVQSQKAVNSGTEYHLLAKSDCGVSKADLVLASDGKLISAKFTLTDGNVLSVEVISMKKTEEIPSDSFSPKRKFGSDWIVTDLR